MLRNLDLCIALAACLGTPAGEPTSVKSELVHARQAEGDSEKIPDEAFPAVVEVLGQVHFASDSARLSADALAALDGVATQWLTRDAGDGAFLEVRGHSDGTGDILSNMKLSRRRAETVERYLRERGIPPERLVALALGPSDPVGDDATAEGRARNRRAEIVAVATRPAVE